MAPPKKEIVKGKQVIEGQKVGRPAKELLPTNYHKLPLEPQFYPPLDPE